MWGPVHGLMSLVTNMIGICIETNLWRGETIHVPLKQFMFQNTRPDVYCEYCHCLDLILVAECGRSSRGFMAIILRLGGRVLFGGNHPWRLQLFRKYERWYGLQLGEKRITANVSGYEGGGIWHCFEYVRVLRGWTVDHKRAGSEWFVAYAVYGVPC